MNSPGGTVSASKKLYDIIDSYKKNNKDTLCSIHLNFFEKPKNRKILMIGKEGKIEANLNTGIVELFKKNKN